MDVRAPGGTGGVINQNIRNSGTHVRIQMHRVDKLRVGKGGGKVVDGTANGTELVAEIFTTMPSDQDKRLTRCRIHDLRAKSGNFDRSRVNLFHRKKQRVNHGPTLPTSALLPVATGAVGRGSARGQWVAAVRQRPCDADGAAHAVRLAVRHAAVAQSRRFGRPPEMMDVDPARPRHPD